MTAPTVESARETRIFIRHSHDLPAGHEYGIWIAIAGARGRGEAGKELDNIPARLEAAFSDIASDWLELGREMGSEPTAPLSHTPACATNVSDFGEMLAWTRIIDDLVAGDARRVLVICDDPWLFRQLATLSNVSVGAAPSLWRRRSGLFVRGYLARLVYAIRAARDTVVLRKHRVGLKKGGTWLHVYGHPQSTAAGRDGYFGDLPQQIPAIWRLLHVDCQRARALELSEGGKIVSLRAWGSLFNALLLPFARWRPARSHSTGPYKWLFRRAAALEGGTAQPAALRWQILCQKAWAQDVSPEIVAWPWENHSWERQFVTVSQELGIRTLGYQHSVIGGQMLNYSPRSCPAGLGSLPDNIFCTGQSTLDQLVGWGIPEARLAIGGALRFSSPAQVRYDPGSPVFVALPFDHRIAAEMVSAVMDCAEEGRIFLVRDHPMTPFEFGSNQYVRRADGPLTMQKSVSAVLYAATTVGLEALVAGLPTLRFRSGSRLSIDIMPAGLNVPATDSRSLKTDLSRASCPAPVERGRVFAEADLTTWRACLQTV